MVTCGPASSWLWYQRITIGVMAGGGVVMIVVGAIVRDGASPFLVVIGGMWFLGGLVNLQVAWRQVREIAIDGANVVFRYRNRDVIVPAREITEIGWSEWDQSRRRSLRFQTNSRGVIKVPSSLLGFVGFLAELERINPRVKMAD